MRCLAYDLVFPADEDTTLEVEIPRSEAVVDQYAMVIKNPSDETDLKVNVFSIEALGDALAETMIVPKAADGVDTHIFMLPETLMTPYGLTNLKLKISNIDVITTGFTAQAMVRTAR